MSRPIKIKSKDTILASLNFKPYRNTAERHFTRFLPAPGQPERIEIATPWGESLTAKPGDYLVSEMDAPDDIWPVDAEIFESTYDITSPGHCAKRALTHLVPMVEVTDGDPEQPVTRITQPGQNISLFVQFAVNSRCEDGQVRVMRVDAANALRCGDQVHFRI